MPVKANSIYSYLNFDKTTIEDIVNAIRTDMSIQKSIDKIRSEKDKSKRDYLKKSLLPVFNLGSFESRITNDGFTGSEYLLYDIDNIPKEDMDKAIETIKPHSALLFLSPSGKGIKFAIKLKSVVTIQDFKVTYLYYLSQFESMTGVILDKTKDARRLCLYSHDVNCYYNDKPELYDIIKSSEKEEIRAVNTSAPCHEELLDIANFLRGKINNYNTWLSIAFSLASINEQGWQYFKIISENSSYNDSEQNIRHTFESCLKTASGKVSLGTLYHIAKENGYKRKAEFVKKTTNNPFVPESGLLKIAYYKSGEIAYRTVLNTDKLEYEFNLIDQNNDIIRIVTIGDVQYRFTADDLVSLQKLKALLLKKGHYLWQGNNEDTVAFINYLINENRDRNVYVKSGLGKISDTLWNFGNFLMIGKEKRITSFEKVVWQDDETGYMLFNDKGENLPRNDVFITDISPDTLVKRVSEVNQIYKEHTAMIFGFVTATLFYDKIIEMRRCFPILFLHGERSTGKTALATLILNMFGANSNPDHTLMANLNNATSLNGVYRMKSDVGNFPTFYDEYKDSFREFLKAMYGAYGSLKAKYTGDNQVRSTEVKGSSIFSNQWIPQFPEAISRCCYMDLTGAKDGVPKELYDSLSENRTDLSCLAMTLASGFTWEKYLEEYKKASDYFAHKCDEVYGIDNRILENHATIAAGFRLFKSLALLSPSFDYDYDVFVPSIKRASSFTDDASPVTDIVMVIRSIFDSGRYETSFKRDNSLFNKRGIKCDVIWFCYDDIENIIAEFKHRFRIKEELSKKEMFAMFAKHPLIYKAKQRMSMNNGQGDFQQRICTGMIYREYNTEYDTLDELVGSDMPF